MSKSKAEIANLQSLNRALAQEVETWRRSSMAWGEKAVELEGESWPLRAALEAVTNLLDSIMPAGDELDEPIDSAVAWARSLLIARRPESPTTQEGER